MSQTKIGNSGLVVCEHGMYFHGEECSYCRMEEDKKTPHEKKVEEELRRIREELERR